MKLRQLSIFKQLSTLPLFHGVSIGHFQQMIEKTPLHFDKVCAGDMLNHSGDPCRSLRYVLQGSVRLSQPGAVTVSQTLRAPQVLGAEYLFGLANSYPWSVQAITDVNTLEVAKEEYRRLFDLDPVFLLNYLNFTCTGAQRAPQALMSLAGASAAQKLTFWVNTLTRPDAVDIELQSSEVDLHVALGIPLQQWRNLLDRSAHSLELVNSRCLRINSRDF